MHRVVAQSVTQILTHDLCHSCTKAFQARRDCMVHSLEENSSEENSSLSVLVGLHVVLVPETNRVDEGVRRYQGSVIRQHTEQISLQ